MLEGTQAVEISRLKEKVSKLEDKLKGCNEKIEALTTEKGRPYWTGHDLGGRGLLCQGITQGG